MSSAEKEIHGQIKQKKAPKRKTLIEAIIPRSALIALATVGIGIGTRILIDSQSPGPASTPSNQSALTEKHESNKMTLSDVMKTGVKKYFITHLDNEYLLAYGPKVVEVEYTPIKTTADLVNSRVYKTGNENDIIVRSDANEKSEISIINKDDLPKYGIRILGDHYSVPPFGYVTVVDLQRDPQSQKKIEGGYWLLATDINGVPVLRDGKSQFITAVQATVTNPNLVIK